jgi:hypothetical protein
MRTGLQDGYILFVFDIEDWNIANNGAQAMILAIKREIKPCNGENPDGWTYDPETKVWSMKNTTANREMFERLAKKHLNGGKA